MKKIDYKNLLLTSCVCLFPMIIGIIMYNKLPNNMAVHFGLNNNPDNFFSKSLFVFGTPIFFTIIQILTFLKTESLDNNKEANIKATTIYKWIIPIICVVMYVVTILYSLGNNIDIRKIVMIVIGSLFIIMGNYTPKTVNSKFIKVPKRLLYYFRKKYYRIYGYLMVINGLLFIISVLFKPMVSFILVVCMIIETLFLYLYAMIIRK